MKKLVLTVLVTTTLASVALAQQIFRSSVQTVPIYATVTDSAGRLVPDLKEADFEVLDNGKPTPLTLFVAEVQPIAVVTAIDTSGSMTLVLDFVKLAAETFVLRLLPHDRGRVVAFDDKILMSPRFTSDRDELVRHLQTEVQFGNGTRLWDAMYQSIAELKDETIRRVVLVLSDGEDTSSKLAGGDDVLARAQTDDVMVYAIGLRNRYRGGPNGSWIESRPDRYLKKLTEQTGGGYFELTRTTELNSTFSRVADELHRQYPDGDLAGGDGWQGAQARRAREGAGHDGPRPKDLHRVERHRQVTEAARMTRRLSFMAGAAALGSAALLAQQAPVYRSATQTVPVYATVTDGTRLVTDLSREDFEILDNGRPQPIVLFDSSIQPISIILMLDTSGSMSGNISVLRNAAVQMFTRLLPDDKARVGNFGDRISISPEWTNNVDDLIRTLWLDVQPGGPTPLWGAVNVSMTAMSRVTGRRVVLVLSDGKDTGPLGGMPGTRPTTQLPNVILRAQTEDFMIYAIGFSSRSAPPLMGGGAPPSGSMSPPPGARGRRGYGGDEGPDPGLQALAAESGGGYFEVTEHTELGPAFARIADELHRQYLIGFVAPENDGKIHKIDVRVRRPGLSVRARNSYQAPRSPKLAHP